MSLLTSDVSPPPPVMSYHQSDVNNNRHFPVFSLYLTLFIWSILSFMDLKASPSETPHTALTPACLLVTPPDSE